MKNIEIEVTAGHGGGGSRKGHSPCMARRDLDVDIPILAAIPR